MKEVIKKIVHEAGLDEATTQSLLSRLDSSEITEGFLGEIKQLVLVEIDKKVDQMEDLVNQARVAHDNFSHTLDLTEAEIEKLKAEQLKSIDIKESSEEELKKLKEIRDYLSQIK